TLREPLRHTDHAALPGGAAADGVVFDLRALADGHPADDLLIHFDADNAWLVGDKEQGRLTRLRAECLARAGQHAQDHAVRGRAAANSCRAAVTTAFCWANRSWCCRGALRASVRWVSAAVNAASASSTCARAASSSSRSSTAPALTASFSATGTSPTRPGRVG